MNQISGADQPESSFARLFCSLLEVKSPVPGQYVSLFTSGLDESIKWKLEAEKVEEGCEGDSDDCRFLIRL